MWLRWPAGAVSGNNNTVGCTMGSSTWLISQHYLSKVDFFFYLLNKSGFHWWVIWTSHRNNIVQFYLTCYNKLKLIFVKHSWFSCLLKLQYTLGRSGRREEILERGKRSNDFERIERGAVWGENLLYGSVEWQ